jgi:hypothetical protein
MTGRGILSGKNGRLSPAALNSHQAFGSSKPGVKEFVRGTPCLPVQGVEYSRAAGVR